MLVTIVPRMFFISSPHEKWYMIFQASSDEWSPNYQAAFTASWSGLKPLNVENSVDR